VRIVLKDAISSAERDAMIAPLMAHNTAQGVDFTSSPFALALEDDGGNILAVLQATPDGAGYTSPRWQFRQSYADRDGDAD
jgi:hypothetical protein